VAVGVEGWSVFGRGGGGAEGRRGPRSSGRALGWADVGG